MNKKFETGVAIDKDSSVMIDKRGKAYSVSFTPDECKAAKNCVFTHNHPRGRGKEVGTLGRIGNSFSVEDISFAVGNDLAEIRAVTPTYTFVMKRPVNGWGISVATLNKNYNSISRRVKRKMDAIISRATTEQEWQRSVERAQALYFHIVWKEFSMQHGIEYIKVKSVQ